jgi:uncharacterized protein YndB with AHSA1/START domain
VEQSRSHDSSAADLAGQLGLAPQSVAPVVAEYRQAARAIARLERERAAGTFPESRRMPRSYASQPRRTMNTQPAPSPDAVRLERTYHVPVDLVWELLTTPAGLEEWFAPDGFQTRVKQLELRPGGQLRYSMTATAPEQVAFMRDTGNPLSVELLKTFTEVAPPARLAYLSVIDFVPGHEPYEHLTTVDIEPAGDRVSVVMTIDPLHDETWTQQYRAHRGNELDNLEEAINKRTA